VISLVLVEDQPDVAAALHLAISSEGDIEVRAICHTLAASVEIVGRDRPDVVLTDFRLSDGDAADRFGEWRTISPGSRVLVLSAWGDDRSVQRARDAGASGYLEKGPDIDALCTAIRRVASGGQQWLGDGSDPAAAGNDASTTDAAAPLDPTSIVIEGLLVSGAGTAEIVSATGLPERSVRQSVNVLLRRHGVKTRGELCETLTGAGGPASHGRATP
jgi:DNA-binding NarL/FixJ family response regulator